MEKANQNAPQGSSQVNLIELEDDFLSVFPEAVANFVSCTGIKRNSTNHRLSKAFPSYTQDYKRKCLRKRLQVGVADAFELGTLFGTRLIFSLPVREHWKEVLIPGRVKSSLESLMTYCADNHVTSLALPRIEGPPEGWLERQLLEQIAIHPKVSLKTVYLFREE